MKENLIPEKRKRQRQNRVEISASDELCWLSEIDQ